MKALTGASRKGFWPAKILRIPCLSHVPKNKTRAVSAAKSRGRHRVLPADVRQPAMIFGHREQ
ncbi:hypothetical protein B4135_1602 [Caldibacillus debilis]|uniref:Uncharacterized protein n=1 Tax=Caldibacillus debilis TaxID=301148 RepID=A0A150MBY6_9BACI|nr:hypothetical protein B4135_1602 [Caldibacillus debilis]